MTCLGEAQSRNSSTYIQSEIENHDNGDRATSAKSGPLPLQKSTKQLIRFGPGNNALLRSQPPDGKPLPINTINRRKAYSRWTRRCRECLSRHVSHPPPTVGVTGSNDLDENVMECSVLNLRHENLSRDAERSCEHGRVRITTIRQTMCTGCIVDPYPVRAVVCQPVLAPVLVIATGAGHVEGLLPAGSKAFLEHV